MEKFEKAGYDVFYYNFDTLYQFIKHIKSAPVNREVFGNDLASQRTNDYDWYQTENFEEAVDLCLSGWSQDFDRFIRLKKRIDEKLLSSIIKPRQVLDVVGYTPSVPDYIMGNPFNMWNQTKRQIPTFVTIYLNIAIFSMTSTNEIFNRGVIALSLIDALEERGYSVRFKVFACSSESDEMIFASFDLKGDGEKLNIKKTYFPLCHPSFFRRLVFALRERTSVTNQDWGLSYGRASGKDIVKKILEPGPNDIIITQPLEMGIKGYDIDEDLEAFLARTNLQEILTKI